MPVVQKSKSILCWLAVFKPFRFADTQFAPICLAESINKIQADRTYERADLHISTPFVDPE